MGGARESFGSSGIIVLADDRRLAAQGARDRRLARLEGIDHIHLKEGQPQHRVRKQNRDRRKSAETQRRGHRKQVSGDAPHRSSGAAEAEAEAEPQSCDSNICSPSNQSRQLCLTLSWNIYGFGSNVSHDFIEKRTDRKKRRS